MPVIYEERKVVSELVKAIADFENIGAVDYNFSRVGCIGSTTIEAIGVPMVWDSVNSAFEVYVAQSIPTTDSLLPDGAPVCLVVGQREGYGVNTADVTLSATAQELTVLFRGKASIVNEGITWGAVTAPNQALFLTALEKQLIAVTTSATSANPAYVS
jgi:hypothetical protein